MPPNGTPAHPSSPQTRFLAEESPEPSEVAVSQPPHDVDNLLSESSLHKLHLECYDECVFNDLPQYLVRISDMRLYSREELWKIFRPLVDATTFDLEKARQTIMTECAGEAQLRKNCKVILMCFVFTPSVES